MCTVTLVVNVCSNCEVGEKHERKFWFTVTEAPREIFVGDTIDFSNGVFVTVTSRSWRRTDKNSCLVIGCTMGEIPFREFFMRGAKINEGEAHLQGITW